MPKKSRIKTGARKAGGVSEISLLTEMTRLLEILVRLNLQTMRKDHNQKEMILMLDSVGCGGAEIADLLQITPNSIGPTLSRAKRR